MTAHRVRLLSRTGCHLCEQAREQLAVICADVGAQWDEVDVDTDPELRSAYGDLVPVVLVDGAEHGYWRIEAHRLRTALLA